MTVPSKKAWRDPVKNHPAKDSTMNTPGDFGKFTDLMRKLVVAPHSDVGKKGKQTKSTLMIK